jgi:hypothetical protein
MERRDRREKKRAPSVFFKKKTHPKWHKIKSQPFEDFPYQLKNHFSISTGSARNLESFSTHNFIVPILAGVSRFRVYAKSISSGGQYVTMHTKSR